MAVLRTNGFIRSGSFFTGSCSRYSLSIGYIYIGQEVSILVLVAGPLSALAISCAPFHCMCPDFLRTSDSVAEISAKAGKWSLY